LTGRKRIASVSIGGRSVGEGAPVLIVAEAGVNHNGDVELARQLVDAAADAGADAVKFQTFAAERVASATAPKAAYQRETTDPGEPQLEMLRRLELGRKAFDELVRRCDERGLMFLSTPFDEESADLVAELGAPAIKVGSGEITNWPLLERVASKGRPVILSTGMATLDEIGASLDVMAAAGDPDVVLLHCVSSYPAAPAEANLRAIETLREAFGLPVGYSDHTLDATCALAATALGACLVEKHLTLDRDLPGPDHRASLEPHTFADLVRAMREVEAALGDGEKRPTSGELENRLLVRRSLAAADPIAAGTVLSADMVAVLRPGTGIPPSERESIVGRRTRRALAAHELIDWNDLE
jgi:N-acetylneuraminate synthase/N,N'-diacetyllegionaminate synthase